MRLYPAGVNILEPLQVENEYWGKSPNLKLLGDLLVGLALYAIEKWRPLDTLREQLVQ